MRKGVALLGVTAVLLAACDTGDGTTLRDPAPDAPPPTDLPIGTVAPDTTVEAAPAATAPPPVATIPVSTDPDATDPDAAETLPAPVGFAVSAPWGDGEVIDPRFGCDGLNASPALSWTAPPAGTAELAVSLVNDSDVSRGEPFVHWIMWGLEPTSVGLDESDAPAGAQLALNFFGNVAYDGPCPDPGDTGVYRLSIHALSQQLEVGEGTPATEVLDAIDLITIDAAATLGSMTR